MRHIARWQRCGQEFPRWWERRRFAYKDDGSGKGLGYDSESGPEQYLRYQITEDGVSPMAIPGYMEMKCTV